MNKALQYIILVVGLLTFISLSIAIPVYKYHDCLKVGHTMLYCILSIGR